MKMHHAATAALAMILLAAGAQAQTLTRSLSAPPIDVTVVDGAIRLSQTSVRTVLGATTLTWQLRTEGYRFNSGSIDFGDAQGYFSCATFNSGLGIRCTKSDQAPSGQLPYRVLLSDGQGVVDLPQPGIFIQID